MALESTGPRTSMIGRSDANVSLLRLIAQVARSRATVLVTGESGTGKELVSRMLHEQSPRAAGPFVRLHCAALSESLLESELFGHEKGAFTGALGRRRGRFEEASGGTLFLDEIGEVPPSMQVKLLRVLQERCFERVGGNETIHVDVRLVAATNRNLKAEVKRGAFREDLFYRLNVIHVQTTPLRERPEDIAPLVHHFLKRLNQAGDTHIHHVEPEAMALLERYNWPGNIRELENAVERAVVLADADYIDVRHLPPDILDEAAPIAPNPNIIQIPGSRLADIERYAILRTYEACGHSTARTAAMLDISVRKVRYKIKEYGVADLAPQEDDPASDPS